MNEEPYDVVVDWDAELFGMKGCFILHQECYGRGCQACMNGKLFRRFPQQKRGNPLYAGTGNDITLTNNGMSLTKTSDFTLAVEMKFDAEDLVP